MAKKIELNKMELNKMGIIKMGINKMGINKMGSGGHPGHGGVRGEQRKTRRVFLY